MPHRARKWAKNVHDPLIVHASRLQKSLRRIFAEVKPNGEEATGAILAIVTKSMSHRGEEIRKKTNKKLAQDFCAEQAEWRRGDGSYLTDSDQADEPPRRRDPEKDKQETCAGFLRRTRKSLSETKGAYLSK